MTAFDREAFIRAFVEAERRLAPLAEACPTVRRLADKEDGTPSYDYFARDLVVDPDLEGDDYPRRRSEHGTELAVDTLKVLAPAMLAQDGAENPFKNDEEEEGGNGNDWLAWQLVDNDGPNQILRAIIIDACWTPPDEPELEHFDDYVRGFLGAISMLAAVGYAKLDELPPGKVRRAPSVLRIVASRAA